jgi:hypothetical protein
MSAFHVLGKLIFP